MQESPSPTLHIVSHTHWDREWYLTFQQFRFRLVRLVDRLLDILDREPDYRTFMLDGQTIVLEDYLDVRPDRAEQLRRHVQAGRIVIGPWHVLPDEFLVSPEALVRNLLVGDAVCCTFGAKMALGYVPDPFGHIGQLPQILRGCSIDTAVFWRGVGEAPLEFTWEAPDGSRVLVCHLRNSYSNVAWLPEDVEGFTLSLVEERERLAPFAATPHLLLMQGTDHLFPRGDLPDLIAAANAALPDRVLHAALPHFVEAVRSHLAAVPSGDGQLPVRRGELRDPSLAHLLPGVLSTRMWIKQRNAACQTLLERWAEPFGAVSALPHRSASVAQLTGRAWRYLLENQPHDSICGCSIDQVHAEMVTRFDWCEQLGEEIVSSALASLAADVDTGAGPLPALVVFNPGQHARTGRVLASVQSLPDPTGLQLLDADGTALPFVCLGKLARPAHMQAEVDRSTLQLMLRQIGRTGGLVWADMAYRSLEVEPDGPALLLRVRVVSGGVRPAPEALREGLDRLQALLADPAITAFRVELLEEETLELAFVARDVPGLGYARYTFAPRPADGQAAVSEAALPEQGIENEYFRVTADPESGTLTVLDKHSGRAWPGCQRFVDDGDRGDEYNYCPPEHDRLVDRPAAPPSVERHVDATGQQLTLRLAYVVPAALDDGDRSQRSELATVTLGISTRVSLVPGVRRVDVETEVHNTARDHRLRVHFPTGLQVDSARAGGHFDVVERSLDLPTETETAAWVEQPIGTQHQLGWVDVSDGQAGLMLANCGLPEYEVLRTAQGAEIALTLLRCVGWLSRDDLWVRSGNAGPSLPTPQAQCLGRYTFAYSLIPHGGDWQAARPAAEDFQTPLRAVSTAAHPGPLPARGAFLTLEPGDLQLSAVKPPERGPGLIVRLWNVSEGCVAGRLRLWRPCVRATRVNLLEEPDGSAPELARNTDAVPLDVGGREVVTLRFEF